jgi:hypothetical protein
VIVHELATGAETIVTPNERAAMFGELMGNLRPMTAPR